jgi:hypothetical protein
MAFYLMAVTVMVMMFLALLDLRGCRCLIPGIGTRPSKSLRAPGASSVGQQELDGSHIALVDQRAFAQGPFALARLRAENMAAKRFVVNDFSRSGLLEPLGSGPVGFNFRHVRISFATANCWLFGKPKQMARATPNLAHATRWNQYRWGSTSYIRHLARPPERLQLVISAPEP